MQIIRSTLPLIYFPLLLINKVISLIRSNKSGGRLRVIMYHDIPPSHYGRFKEQMKWISQGWKFITLNEFEEIMQGKRVVDGDSVLLTFDDGFISNRYVCEKVLDPMGIKALFFVISEYVKMDKESNESRGFLSNIYPETTSEDHSLHMRNMGIPDIKYLLKNGHSVGAHTATHKKLSDLKDEKSLTEEIINSADLLESLFQIRIKHFAFPFGTFDSFSEEALKIAQKRFSLIYTGMRGNNDKLLQTYGIRRDAITTTDSLWAIGAFLEGAADYMYSDRLRVYDRWADG